MRQTGTLIYGGENADGMFLREGNGHKLKE